MWLNNDKLLLSQDRKYELLQLKSRVLLTYDDFVEEEDPMKDTTHTEHFIKAVIKTEQDGDSSEKIHQVSQFTNYTGGMLRTADYKGLHSDGHRRLSVGSSAHKDLKLKDRISVRDIKYI